MNYQNGRFEIHHTVSDMISAISSSVNCAQDIGSATPAQSAKAQKSSSIATASTTNPTATQSSAKISSPGQLLSDLQALQAKDPTKFKQVVADIASQLQVAASQSQGPQSDFLSNLATKFQDASNTGSISQLQPTKHGHHHHRVHQAYSQGSTRTADLTGLAQTTAAPQATGGINLQNLFKTISSEVSQALGSSAV